MAEEARALGGLGPVNEHSALAGRPNLIKNTYRALLRSAQCCGQETPEPTHGASETRTSAFRKHYPARKSEAIAYYKNSALKVSSIPLFSKEKPSDFIFAFSALIPTSVLLL